MIKKRKSRQRKSQPLLPALIAVGGVCSLAAVPAGALELGDIQIDSALGQPLRASIAYALNPAEQLSDFCIYLQPGVSASSIPTVARARISVTNNAIVLTGSSPIREPMLGIRIAVDCPYAPHLLREYTLMVDPAPAATTARSPGENVEVIMSGAGAVAPPPVVRQPSASSVRTSLPTPVADRLPATPLPIAMSAQYRVQPGDTVSTVVSRIEDRTIALWPAVYAVFAANPAAFIDSDINRLKAGSLLTIPDMSAGMSGTVSKTGQSVPAPSVAAENVESYVAAATDSSISNVPEAAAEVAALEAVSADADVAEVDPGTPTGNTRDIPAGLIVEKSVTESAPSGNERFTELRPGDVIVAPTGTPAAETVMPKPFIGGDSATPTTPVVSYAASDNTGTTGAWNWLLWLGGTGLALILGLLLFGRTARERFGRTARERFGSVAVGSREAPGRRRIDGPARTSRVIEEIDFQFEDTVNAQAISLDADLEAGTGLNAGTEMDVAHDFGFSATGETGHEVDLVLPDRAVRETADMPTESIAADHRIDESSFLENDSQHSGDDEYDFSIMIDATKQPIGECDGTVTDLEAVRIDAGGGAAKNDDYSFDKENDYEVLEQDYEDELTATQTLNAEMAKAAMELAVRMELDEHGDATSQMPALDLTSEMPAADSTAEMPSADVTRDLPAGKESGDSPIEILAVSGPELTAELNANLPIAVEAENDAEAVSSDSALTVERSTVGSDITIEMQSESGGIDTKKK